MSLEGSHGTKSESLFHTSCRYNQMLIHNLHEECKEIPKGGILFPGVALATPCYPMATGLFKEDSLGAMISKKLQQLPHPCISWWKLHDNNLIKQHWMNLEDASSLQRIDHTNMQYITQEKFPM